MELRKPEDVIIGDMTLKEILEKESVHANLRGTDLSYVDLSYAILRHTNLHDVNLAGACLYNADLYYADLSYADLQNANLSYCDLSYAYLRHADLSHANLIGACLHNTNLQNANLSYCDLKYANLLTSDLSCADLRNANLEGTNLEGTNLFRAIGDHFEYRRGKKLTESIIGYKVCKDHVDGMPVIVTLEIPRGAIVFSINRKKCRTDKAKVLKIGNGHVINRAYSINRYMTYYVGDEFTVYNFNCEYNVECAEGIHFFMTREDAIDFAHALFRNRK